MAVPSCAHMPSMAVHAGLFCQGEIDTGIAYAIPAVIIDSYIDSPQETLPYGSCLMAAGPCATPAAAAVATTARSLLRCASAPTTHLQAHTADVSALSLTPLLGQGQAVRSFSADASDFIFPDHCSHSGGPPPPLSLSLQLFLPDASGRLQLGSSSSSREPSPCLHAEDRESACMEQTGLQTLPVGPAGVAPARQEMALDAEQEALDGAWADEDDRCGDVYEVDSEKCDDECGDSRLEALVTVAYLMARRDRVGL